MKKVFLILALAGFLVRSLTAISQEADPLLDASYNMSANFGGREQLFYLIEFCRLGVVQSPPWERIQHAASTLFDLSTTEKDRDLRTIGQKEGAACISYVDPRRGMTLLSNINFVPSPQGKFVYQDPRYNAAETIFVNFINEFRLQAVDDIASTARYLGRSGQYPYHGIARIINSGLISKDEANALLRDAVQFYSKEGGFYNRDEEFLALLLALKGSAVDEELITLAVNTFVRRLRENPIKFPGDYYSRIRITSTGKVFSFTDRNEAFLFRAFPQIKRFDPGLALQLVGRDFKLRYATDNMSYVLGGFVPGDPTSAEVAKQHLQWLQESLLTRIRDCQRCSPQALELLARRLVDPDLSIVGFSDAIAGIKRASPSRARALFRKELSDIGNLGDSIGRLRAMVALTSAAYNVGNSNQYTFLCAQAFDRAIQFFNADSGAKRAARRQGFNELRELVLFTASQPGDVLRTRVEKLPDGWLKAYLYLYEVQGHSKLRHSPGGI